MRVGFDLDGVLYDFGASVKRYREHIGKPIKFKDDAPEPHTWNFFEFFEPKMTGAEFKQMCDDGADAGFIFCGPARPAARACVESVKNMKHEVIIITDRKFGTTPEVSEENTRNWLKKNKIPYDELYFSADKTIVPTDMFIEDKLENYDALTAAGTDCYLINRDWNQEHGPDDRQRIDTLWDYQHAVFRKSFNFSLPNKVLVNQ
jgi:5'(3')-deoxyribonucleotidase